MASVVIACYNHAPYIAEAIESALPQADVVVVDDGSTDNSVEVARRYPVTLITQNNRGVSAARNIGIEHTDAEHVMCLDADDVLAPTAIADLIGLDDIVSPSVRMFGAVDDIWIPELAHPTYEDFLRANYCTCASLIRREVWERIGGFDEAMRDGGEDWDFWTRAALAGFGFTVVSDLLLRYRRHADNSDRPNSSGRLRDKREEVHAYLQAKWNSLERP